MTLSPSDPNCIFYVDFQDGRGGTARDQSKSGLDVTLTGGPAWLDQRFAFADWFDNVPYSNPTSSSSYTSLFGHHLFFTAIDGEDAETISTTTVFDFSPRKPFMMAWIYSPNSVTIAAQTTIFNWTQLQNACGFSLEHAAGGSFTNPHFVFTGVEDVIIWPLQITDTRPHMYGIWRNESGAVDIFFDGKFLKSFSGTGVMNSCAGGSQLAIARDKAGAPTDFAGRFGRFQIWNTAIPRYETQAFFRAWYEDKLGGHYGTFDQVNP